jgi:hypothetical protein
MARRNAAGAAPAPSADPLEGREMPPTKGNGLDASNIQPAETTYQTNDLNFATTERRRKTQATATALLALRGFVVEPYPNGDFLVTANGLSQYLQDLEALQDFAKGVRHG